MYLVVTYLQLLISTTFNFLTERANLTVRMFLLPTCFLNCFGYSNKREQEMVTCKYQVNEWDASESYGLQYSL